MPNFIINSMSFDYVFFPSLIINVFNTTFMQVQSKEFTPTQGILIIVGIIVGGIIFESTLTILITILI